MRLEGGCFCGFVRYAVDGAPFDETFCHCSICRRTTGAPVVAWFSVKRSEFRFVSGAPLRFRTTPGAERAFCPRCGTQLTFAHDGLPGEIDITTSSLDTPDVVPPRDHSWAGSKLRWVQFGDGLAAYPEKRPVR